MAGPARRELRRRAELDAGGRLARAVEGGAAPGGQDAGEVWRERSGGAGRGVLWAEPSGAGAAKGRVARAGGM